MQRQEESSVLSSASPRPATPAWAHQHARALQTGEAFYWDAELSAWVMTAEAHLKRGSCCGSHCRHCPYGLAPSSDPTPTPSL